jgi:hypothetical protein
MPELNLIEASFYVYKMSMVKHDSVMFKIYLLEFPSFSDIKSLVYKFS